MSHLSIKIIKLTILDESYVAHLGYPAFRKHVHFKLVLFSQISTFALHFLFNELGGPDSVSYDRKEKS